MEKKKRERESSPKGSSNEKKTLPIKSTNQSRLTHLLQLAQILYSKVFFFIIIIHAVFHSPNPSGYPHFTFHSIPDGLSKSEASTSDPIHLTDLINIRCAEPLKQCLENLLSVGSQEEKIACLIADAALHFTQGVCDKLNLPRLVLRTGGASSFVVFASFPLLREKGYLPIQGGFFFIFA